MCERFWTLPHAFALLVVCHHIAPFKIPERNRQIQKRERFFTLSAVAEEAIRRIAALYAVEQRVRGQSPGERTALRQIQAKQLFDGLETWLETQLPKISGKSPLAGAIRDALNRLPKARPYLDNRHPGTG
jgi:hypothetical protein